MNERIEKLLNKAQKITAENHAPGGRDYEREIYSNFAELLIRECLEQIDDGNSDHAGGNREAIDRIKEHFGVEE